MLALLGKSSQMSMTLLPLCVRQFRQFRTWSTLSIPLRITSGSILTGDQQLETIKYSRKLQHRTRRQSPLSSIIAVLCNRFGVNLTTMSTLATILGSSKLVGIYQSYRKHEHR
jgi:hypothetical protein